MPQPATTGEFRATIVIAPSWLGDQPHRRRNPLTGDTILVSPHRALRPWQGATERIPAESRPAYDPACYLCPGNLRAGGVRNPHYDHTFVFDNDFAALRGAPGDARPLPPFDVAGLLEARPEFGICRVVCFSPRHDLSLPDLPLDEVRRVVDVWVEEYTRLGARPDIRHVQIFENKGAMMGTSNPHPHCQIWAQDSLPDLPARELAHQREFFAAKGETLLTAYVRLEVAAEERVVCANDAFVVLVPFWAVWPFETLVVPRRAVPHIAAFDPDERQQFAEIIRRLTIRYDNLFASPFPYSAGIHQAPTGGGDHPECHLHMHFLPPLLRSATVRKFFVGYEMLAEAQRDITPESAAARLRELPDTLYRSSLPLERSVLASDMHARGS